MSETKELLRRGVGDFEPTRDAFERVLLRRDRKRRNQRVAAGVLGIAVFALSAIGFVRLLGSERTPASDPRSPFLGIWVTTDGDGSTPTMTMRASGDGAVEIVVHDDLASACSGAPSTITGTGRPEGSTELVIPSPVLTCDDGSEPEALSGPPFEEQLRDLTFVHDPETDALTDNFGSIWERVRGGDPSPGPTTSAGMWPQSSLEEVREAQRLADAGNPRFTWQVEPELETHLDDAEIFARFLREELGWEEFLWNPFPGYEAGDPASNNETFSGLVYVRCAPGRTNPLYPNDPRAGGCAPTIDELRYETVRIDVAQLARQGSSGIWVVTRWAMIPPVKQMTPPSGAEVTELLNAFLEARVAGEGAQEYVNGAEDDIPLLYATTAGAPYERSEFERVDGPDWPNGWMEFKVRLFAEGGKTVVEQRFFIDPDATGRLGLDFHSDTPDIAPTTENGQAVAVPYNFLDGEVTFAAPWPWDYSWGGWDHGPTKTALFLDNNHKERIEVVADPLPIETGCQEGPGPADAQALARSIRSDTDLEATEPVAVSVGGTEALRMDVVAAPGASACDDTMPLLTEFSLDHRERTRLYLLDLPEGLSARILAIAIVAPEARFERVVKAATPIVNSFEFRTR